MTLEERLHEAMLAMYRIAGRETGYWGNYFLRSVRRSGGVAAAKRLLLPFKGDGIPAGLQKLRDAKRGDLSLEVLVLRPEFAPLFTQEELAEAQRRVDTILKDAMPRPIDPENNYPETAVSDEMFEEGGKRQVTINAYERDSRARYVCIKKYGARCAACGMSFAEIYGVRGEGFIHVHHRMSASARKRAHKLDPVKDLVPVCPNCHAMLHTQDPPLSVEELAAEMERHAG